MTESIFYKKAFAMSNLRRLRPLILSKGMAEKRVTPGSPPNPILLKTSQLRINDEYQRSLSQDSSAMAVKIAVEFDWELYHLLVVSPIDEKDEITGLPLYEILDGQHTAIGAITNGNIKELWCWPGRMGETVEARAGSFLKLNIQRTNVTPVQLFWASVTEKNEEALEVIEACHRTGASIVKRPKPYGDMREGETICTAALMRLAKKGGVVYVERVLRVATDLRLAPISMVWINALEELLLKQNGPHYVAGDHANVNLAVVSAVRRIGEEALVRQAGIDSATTVPGEREPVYWYLAYHIKQEVKAHASRG